MSVASDTDSIMSKTPSILTSPKKVVKFESKEVGKKKHTQNNAIP